jgi:CRP-like cAMP-binding protein
MTKITKTSINKIRLFAGLSPAEREQALTAGRAEERVFAKYETIHQERDLLNSFLILMEGRVQGVHFHADGSLDLVQLFSAGDIIGLDIVCSASKRIPFSLCALDGGAFWAVNYDALFSEHLEHGLVRKLRENLICELARDSLKRLHKIEVLYRKSLRERICVFLRNRASLSGERHVEIDMDREQFAQYLGVNRSSLSHELAMMRQDGLIEFHKGSFKILSDEVFE